MKNKLLPIILSMSVACSALTGCMNISVDLSSLNIPGPSDISAMFTQDFVAAMNAPDPVAYAFSDTAKGAELLLASYENMDPAAKKSFEDLLASQGISLDEYKASLAQHALELTPEDEKVITDAMERLQEKFTALGFSFPIADGVSFVKTTMAEKPDSMSYANGNDIFLSEEFFDLIQSESAAEDFADFTLGRELFYVLAENDPSFKANMYNIIGFNLNEKAPEFSDDVKKLLVFDPSLGDYLASGTFTIDGKPTEAVIVAYMDPNVSEGEIGDILSGVVPVDKPDRIYPSEEIPDFLDVVGYNAGYARTAEECLADNFGYALSVAEDEEFDSPAIIEEILNYLATGEETVPVTGEFTPEESTPSEGAADGSKSVEEVAGEVVRGLWGNGTDRIEALEAAGYDSDAVQQEVNRLMSGK